MGSEAVTAMRKSLRALCSRLVTMERLADSMQLTEADTDWLRRSAEYVAIEADLIADTIEKERSNG